MVVEVLPSRKLGRGERLDLAAYVQSQAQSRKSYYRPRDDRMDEWYLMYLLIDQYQRRKPVGVAQFETNMPMTAVDRSVEILTGNPLQWHIMYDREQEAERDLIRRLELLGTGAFDDINQLLTERYEMEAEVQAAWYALVRGWICSETTITEDSGRDDSPLWFNHWDMRYVYPRRSTNGLRDVVYSNDVTLEELMEDYPDAEVRLEDGDATVSKHIWYDGENYAVVADYIPKGVRRFTGDSERSNAMLFSVKHGLSKIPVQIVPADGVPVRSDAQYPSSGTWTDATNTSGTTRGRDSYHEPRSWTAGQGRSILASTEKTTPQYNEFISVLQQAVTLYSFPTVKLFSKDGTLRKASIGTGIANAFSRQRQEDMEFERPQAAPPGIEGVLATLGREQSVGLLPPALMDYVPATSGFDRAQLTNIAITRIGPWGRCLNRWQEAVFQSVIRQIRETGISLTLSGQYPRENTFFEITFEPEEITRMYRIRAERTPALPDDMMQRAQLAEILLNPARPVASLRTVFDKVLNWPDVEGEETRIFADQALSHPAVIARRMERALADAGLWEYMDIAKSEVVISAIAQQMKAGQAMAAARSIQAPPGTTGAMPGTNVRPEALPPEMGQNAMAESGRQAGQMPIPGL